MLNASKKMCFFILITIYFKYLVFCLFVCPLILFRLIQNKRIEYEKIGVQITANLGEIQMLYVNVF